MNPAKTQLKELHAIVVLLERGKVFTGYCRISTLKLDSGLEYFWTQSSASCRWRVHTSSVWHRPLSSNLHLYMGLGDLDITRPSASSLLGQKTYNLGVLLVYPTLTRACVLSGWCQGTFEPSGPFHLPHGACFSPTTCLSKMWPVSEAGRAIQDFPWTIFFFPKCDFHSELQVFGSQMNYMF